MAARVRRFDQPLGELSPPRVHPSGYVEFDGRFARTGIQEYENPDGSIRRELRLPAAVFDAASLASWRGVPVTAPHPPELVTPDNARTYQRGQVIGDVAREGDWIRGRLMVTDGPAIQAVRGGAQQELSGGYECDLLPPDPALVAEWGPHDAIQDKIVINHLALVPAARAGHEARVRIDAAGHALAPASKAPAGCVVRSPQQDGTTATTQETQTMPITLKLNGRTVEVTDATAALLQADIDATAKRADDATTALGRTAAAVDKIRALIAADRARRDAMKARMIDCDECGGSGKIGGTPTTDAPKGAVSSTKVQEMDPKQRAATFAHMREQGYIDAEGEACPWCGGTGKIRMHDAVREAMPVAEQAAQEETAEEVAEAAEEAKHAAEMQKIHEPIPAAKPRGDAARTARVQMLAEEQRALKAKRGDAQAKRAAARIAARVQLEQDARKVLGADAKLDGMSDAQVKRAVVEKRSPAGARFDDSTIPGAYALILAQLAAEPSAIDQARGPGPRTDGAGAQRNHVEDARQRMIDAQNKAALTVAKN